MKKILLISVLSLSSSVFAADYQKVGDWLVSKEENKLTDKIDYYAILSAKIKMYHLCYVAKMIRLRLIYQ